MDRIVEKSLLFDFYGDLLTNHQKSIYAEYIQEDVSVSEIAEIHGITRQGAHDMIRRCEKLLAGYESRLHLVDHYLKIRDMVREIHRCAEEIGSISRHVGIEKSGEAPILREKVAYITQRTEDILEQY
jgi:predicted DNA-binding protein YlxM (UPF0122 family)